MKLAARNGKTEILLPEGFDSRECLPAGFWRHRDRINLIVSAIATKQAMLFRQGSYVGLGYDDGSRLAGGHTQWDRYMGALEEHQIIECDGVWRKGKKPLGYRLAHPWSECDLVPAKIGDARLLDILAEHQAKRSLLDQWDPVHHHLAEIARRTTLDEDRARRYLCRPASPKQQHGRRIATLIRAGEGRFSLSQHGRFYSVYTQTPRVIRKCFLIDGKTAIERDISACQPLLLALLCAQSHALPSRFPALALTPSCQQTGSQGGSIYMSPIFAPNVHKHGIPTDVREYIEHCQSGSFYEEFGEAVGIDASTEKGRRRSKRKWCHLNYGDVNPANKRWIRYADRYPTVAATAEKLKQGNHRHVSHVLQRLESAIMIGGVSEQLRVERPELAFVGIHDCLAVPENAVDLADRAMLRNWGKYGCTPRIK
jgi:hypothetical protein